MTAESENNDGTIMAPPTQKRGRGRPRKYANDDERRAANALKKREKAAAERASKPKEVLGRPRKYHTEEERRRANVQYQRDHVERVGLYQYNAKARARREAYYLRNGLAVRSRARDRNRYVAAWKSLCAIEI